MGCDWEWKKPLGRCLKTWNIFASWCHLAGRSLKPRRFFTPYRINEVWRGIFEVFHVSCGVYVPIIIPIILPIISQLYPYNSLLLLLKISTSGGTDLWVPDLCCHLSTAICLDWSAVFPTKWWVRSWFVKPLYLATYIYIYLYIYICNYMYIYIYKSTRNPSEMGMYENRIPSIQIGYP